VVVRFRLASNYVSVGNGTDTIVLGNGTDNIDLGYGSDTVVVSASAGDTSATEQAVIKTTATGTSELDFTSATSEQLWFERSGDDLIISVIGTSTQIDVANWYDSSANQVQTIETADGKTLSNSQVEALVDAMASFSAPAAGSTALPESYQSQLEPVIAASYH